MLFHSPMSVVYLARRQRLFQVSNQLRSSSAPSPSQPSIMSKEEKQQWLIKFGSNLETQVSTMKQIKQCIESVSQTAINQLVNQILQILKLSIHFLSASKISNTLYYLCRKSQQFKKQLIPSLQQYLKFITNNKMCHFKQKLIIILSDIFIFGIYFTQNQYIQQIIPSVFSVTYSKNEQQKMINFHFHYLIQYFQILYKTNILLQRHKLKINGYAQQFITNIAYKYLSKNKICTEESLKQLRNSYLYQQQKIKQKQISYLQSVKQYQKTRHSLLHASQIIINSMHLLSAERIRYTQLVQKIQNQFICILPSQQFVQEQYDDDLGKQNDYEDETLKIQTPTSSKTEKNKQKLLLQNVYNNCKYFKNKQIYIKDDLYIIKKIILNNNNNNNNNNNGYQYSFIQILPQQYINNLLNCGDIETSDKLIYNFIVNYNKHANRVTLVNNIMMEMYERNNIAYIIRVLAGIAKQEKQEIKDLLQQKLIQICNKSVFNVYKGEYGKYSNVVTELVKFQLTSPMKYLANLLQFIKILNGIPIITSQNTLPNKQQQQNTAVKQKSTKMLTITQIICLLQKLGRHTYYHSLDSHILFNQIINKVYNHMKNKSIGYDIETIHRFNGLVSFLRNEVQIILPVDQLTGEKRFKQVVKNMKQQIKQKQGIQKICDIIQNSMPNQNYILSYFYAELIEQINCKKLDEQIKQMTKNNIINQFKQGNYQGAANWSRFLGQLHRYHILGQSQLLQFLMQKIVKQFVSLNINSSMKMVCSALDTCSNYMKKTNKIYQIQQTLQFLLKIKTQYIGKTGLTIIMEHQLNQILQNFHPAFKYLESQQKCNEIFDNVMNYGRIQNIMNDFYWKQKNDETKLTKQSQLNENDQLDLLQVPLYKQKSQNQYKQKLPKYIEKNKQALSRNDQNGFQDYIAARQQQNLQMLLKPQLLQFDTETNNSEKSQQKKSQTSSNECPKQLQIIEIPVKKIENENIPKKIKVIGRSKNHDKKKLQKIQICLP